MFSQIATVLRSKYGEKNIFVVGEQTKVPAIFPAVTIIEADNSPVSSRRTTDSIENAADLMYEVNVYSNLTTGKKAQAKEIISIIDTEFAKLGFTRIKRTPADNLEDTTIYRYFSRYTGRVVLESYDEYTKTYKYRIYST